MFFSFAIKFVGFFAKRLYAVLYAAFELYLDAAVPYAITQHSYLWRYGRDV